MIGYFPPLGPRFGAAQPHPRLQPLEEGREIFNNQSLLLMICVDSSEAEERSCPQPSFIRYKFHTQERRTHADGISAFFSLFLSPSFVGMDEMSVPSSSSPIPRCPPLEIEGHTHTDLLGRRLIALDSALVTPRSSSAFLPPAASPGQNEKSLRIEIGRG